MGGSAATALLARAVLSSVLRQRLAQTTLRLIQMLTRRVLSSLSLVLMLGGCGFHCDGVQAWSVQGHVRSRVDDSLVNGIQVACDFEGEVVNVVSGPPVDGGTGCGAEDGRCSAGFYFCEVVAITGYDGRRGPDKNTKISFVDADDMANGGAFQRLELQATAHDIISSSAPDTVVDATLDPIPTP